MHSLKDATIRDQLYISKDIMNIKTHTPPSFFKELLVQKLETVFLLNYFIIYLANLSFVVLNL